MNETKELLAYFAMHREQVNADTPAGKLTLSLITAAEASFLFGDEPPPIRDAFRHLLEAYREREVSLGNGATRLGMELEGAQTDGS